MCVCVCVCVCVCLCVCLVLQSYFMLVPYKDYRIEKQPFYGHKPSK